MTPLKGADVPKYDITVTLHGVTPEVWDEYDVEDVKADPLAYFNEDLGLASWVRSAAHFDIQEVTES